MQKIQAKSHSRRSVGMSYKTDFHENRNCSMALYVNVFSAEFQPNWSYDVGT